MSSASTERRRARGFSVVEALVALFVFAMAGVALIQMQAHSLRTFTDVERRALAAVVAQNALVEAAAGLQAPDLGGRDSEVELAGRQWRAHVEVEATPDAAMRRVTALVRERADAAPVAQVMAFVGVRSESAAPAPPGGPS
jgi:general secretion pathway protein I